MARARRLSAKLVGPNAALDHQAQELGDRGEDHRRFENFFPNENNLA
jgi:hypothetical protein